jgi:hypothetical protein
MISDEQATIEIDVIIMMGTIVAAATAVAAASSNDGTHYPNTDLNHVPWIGCASSSSSSHHHRHHRDPSSCHFDDLSPKSPLSLLHYYLHMERQHHDQASHCDDDNNGFHVGDIIVANSRLCYVSYRHVV